MAEIAIPMALLGGMFILSNQEKDEKKNKQQTNKNNEMKDREGFQANRTLHQNRQTRLPNHRIPPQNFPVNGTSELKQNPQYYPNPNAATDRYFQEVVYEEQAEQDKNTYKSLTGEKVNARDMTHNNMVPFFGSKVHQTNKYTESTLDNLNGSGSQHFSKKEQAPLFSPEENMRWEHGTPNTSNFIQSRMNPSRQMNNVKPFQEVRVGPGLNQKDGVLGSGGFNSGLEARERWISKTVDELRTKTNPKVTYGGVVLGGKNPVTNRGIMGKMEKYRPDTYFINSPERYFTTTGIEKAQTARSQQIMPNENRIDTTREYYGAGNDAQGEATYVRGQYMETRRPQLDPNIKHVSNAYAVNKHNPTHGDYGIKGYKDAVITNNRSINSNQKPQYGAVSTFAKAIIAPIMDVLRPTRKENVIGNMRPVGNAGTKETLAGYVYNPADRAKTTIREMTENRPDHYNINNQKESGGYGYLVNEQQDVAQQRDTTNCEYIGNVGNENIDGYGYLVNEQQDVAQQRDTTNCEYTGNAGNPTIDGYGYIVNKHQDVSQQRDTTTTEYTGNAGTYYGTEKPMTYNAAYNAHLIDKEPISRGRDPMNGNMTIFNGQNYTNIKVDKLETDRNNNRLFVPQHITKSSATTEQIGKLTARSEYGQDIHNQRNNPEILDALKNNPYAKPFNSVA